MAASGDAEGSFGLPNRSWNIFLITLLGMFLELLVIRWISTEIRIFAYLQNTVLVVCFLGLGMGCFTCRQEIRFRDLLIPLTVISLLLAIPITHQALGRISWLLSVLHDFLIWTPLQGIDNPLLTATYLVLGLAMTFILMVLIWDMFIPIGRLMAREMNDHPHTIWAYSVNVAGGLCGTCLFVLLSALHAPPYVWCGALAALLVPYLGRSARERGINIAMLLVIVGCSWFASGDSSAIEVVWSPYQKLTTRKVVASEKVEAGEIGDYVILVNNIEYQEIIDLSDEAFRTRTDYYAPEMQHVTQYDLPTRMHADPQNVLIVGAGSGNDVAGALRQGAKHVVAVDIDPVIVDVGKRFHPEKPYSDPRVELIIDDARSYFSSTNQKFDVISFGLLDSHTTTSMTNARLDHYVYTVECFRKAKELLKPGGVIVLSFYVQRPYIGDRIRLALREVFGEEPFVFVCPQTRSGRGACMFVAGDQAALKQRLASAPELKSRIEEWQRTYMLNFPGTTVIATDDWPYLYLETPRIPVLHFLLAGMLGLLYLRGRWQLRKELAPSTPAETRTQWHFFFLGAAFLLLEVQNISKAAVVLGNTWEVAAVIVSAVLVMVLIANGIAALLPKLPIVPVYACLLTACLGLYFFDLSTLAGLPYPTRAVAVGLITTLPMLFSGIIFVRSFALSEGKDRALGANLFGALVGAMLQTLTFITGVKALLLVVAGLYALSFFTRPK